MTKLFQMLQSDRRSRFFGHFGYLLFASLIWLVAASSFLSLSAHVGEHPSVHDTIASIKNRLKKELSLDELRALKLPGVEAFLTKDERHILGTEHLSFRVNVPVIVSVVRDVNLGNEPFWLKEQNFKQTELRVQVGSVQFDVWQQEFEIGWVGLGVNSLIGGREHYFVAVAPNPKRSEEKSEKLEIVDIYPGQHTLGSLKAGEKPFIDRPDAIQSLPPELENQRLIRTFRSRRDEAKLVDVFRFTSHAATERPDHIVLTWSDDPKTTQTVQWRTSAKVKKGVLAYQRKGDYNSFKPKAPKHVEAKTTALETPEVVNDPVVHRHTAILRDLQPDTTYLYSVGDGTEDGWTELAEFTTAPNEVKPFSFIYMGDAQNGLDRWGTLIHNAFLRRPDVKFYMMAGDIVNRGAERDDWDDLFYNAEGVYDRRQLVPAIGNHECQGGHPTLYLKQFTLPTNGPPEVEAERVYSIEYSNSCFIILDSNLPPGPQAAWLEEQLAKTKATWKFVMFHHPIYSSTPGRDNKSIREVWVPIFDKYHVDMVLQGHDHAYLRTYPMKNNERAQSAKEGTIYVISVSGVKMYKQDPRDYTEFGFTNISTYQVLDVQISGNRLLYRAYDIDGNLKDEVIIEK